MIVLASYKFITQQRMFSMSTTFNKTMKIIALYLMSSAAMASTATYTLVNGPKCNSKLDVTISEKSASGTVKIDIGFRGYAGAKASCTLSGPGRSCDGASINVHYGRLVIEGNFKWDKSNDLIIFNGKAVHGKCAQVDFTNSPMGIVD
jgi:hypothetical protein